MLKPRSTPEPKSRGWHAMAQRAPVSHRARRTPILLGIAAITAAVGGLCAWSATAPISSAVVASGQIAVASKRKEIQHILGGVVKAIHVRDGDFVKKGSVLLVLDDAKAKVRLALARAAYFSAACAQARLVAERDGADTIAFADTLLAEARRSADIELTIANQRRLFEARRSELAGQIKIWMQRIDGLKQEIAGLDAERNSAAQQSDLAAQEAVVIEDMFERGYTNRQRLHSIRRESTQLAGSIGRLDASIAKARNEIGETMLSIRQLTLKRQSEVLAELKDIEQRIFDLNATYLAAAEELEHLTVTAPVDGVVVNSQLHTIGGVVRQGETVLEIVPDADALIVEARVRPLDIDEVEKGQTTEVRFSGLKQRTTPFLTGIVSQVSADAMTDPRTGVLFYRMIVSIPNAELARLGHRLQPGMPAELLVKTGKRTPLAYLTQPFLDSMHKALREQ